MIEEKIVGKWRWDTITYDFHRDGTYDYANTSSGARTNGRYSINGNILTYYVSNGVITSSEFSLSGNGLTLIPTANNPNRNGCCFSQVN